jgi:hypothetical protein
LGSYDGTDNVKEAGMEIIETSAYANIRELEIAEATLLQAAAQEEGCADRCYDGPGCDCSPAGPDSGKAGYNLGLALSNWLLMP